MEMRVVVVVVERSGALFGVSVTYLYTSVQKVRRV